MSDLSGLTTFVIHPQKPNSIMTNLLSLLLLTFHLITLGMFYGGNSGGPLMATIKLGPIVSEIRGLLGGTIFSRNGAGAYAKQFTKPTNPQTPAQQAIRNLLTAVSARWTANLSDAERESWIAAAPTFPLINKVGEVYFLSGKGLHDMLNLTLNIIGEAFIPSPPAQSPAQEMAIAALAADTGAGTLVITMDQNITPGQKAIIEATVGVNAGVNNVSNKYRQIAVFDDTTLDPIAFTADLALFYTPVFGSLPTVGRKVFVRVTTVNVASAQRAVPIADDDIAV